MNNQRGFLQLSMMAWGAVAAGAVILSLSGAVYVQTVRLNGCKGELTGAKAQIAVLAAQMDAQNRAVEALQADGRARSAQAAAALLAQRERSKGIQKQADSLQAALNAAKGRKPSACPAGDAAQEVRRALAPR